MDAIELDGIENEDDYDFHGRNGCDDCGANEMKNGN